MHLRLALIGFGNVGRATAELLIAKAAAVQQAYGLTWAVTAIASGRHGRAINPDGIDLEDALGLLDLNELHQGAPVPDTLALIRESPADVLLESIPLDPQGGQPALDYLRAALEGGMHAITANKGPVAYGYRELSALAEAQGVRFLFESTVMDGVPVFRMCREALPGTRVLGYRGILNSTTNFVLAQMEAGMTFDEALSRAQEAGIAESDPSLDIDGWDAAIKSCLLSNVLLGTDLRPAGVQRTGIRDLTLREVVGATRRGKHFKLVCSAEREGEGEGEGEGAGVVVRVQPELVSGHDILAQVSGTSSLLTLQTDTLKQLTLVEHDPTPAQTAYGLLGDLLSIVHAQQRALPPASVRRVHGRLAHRPG